MTKITYKGHQYDADAAINLMDDEIREKLHSARDWKSEQEFFDAYVKAHAETYCKDFVIN